MKSVEKKRQLDPVCGRSLEQPDGQPTSEYKKRKYFFCSERCRTAFEKQAERFRMNDLARAGALMTPSRVRWGLA
jgi:YHS domain-containing protein